MILDNLQVGAIAVVLGIGIGGYCGWHWTSAYKDAKYEKALAEGKLAVEQQYSTKLKQTQDAAAKDRLNAKESIQTYEDRLAKYQARMREYDLDDRAWRLRVNVPAGSCQGSSPDKGGSTNPSPDVSVEARIPDETRKRLSALAREADLLRLWGESCFVQVNKPSCVCL